MSARHLIRVVIGGALMAALSAPLALAQSPPGTWTGLPDRFQIDTGYFRLTADSVLRYNGPQGGSGEVNLEHDLGLDDRVDTFWVDATWRVGRRHQLKLAFTRFNRDRRDFTLQRDFTWGGETYQAGLSASTSNRNAVLGGYYRFAAFRNDRFEIGPTIGIGYLKLEARIQATGTVSGPGGSESRTLDEGASAGSPTGAVGGYAEVWPARRFVVRGDFLYIKVKPGDEEASVTDWRLAADYYFFKNAGVGVQYKYYRYSYDRGVLVSELGGEVTFKGFPGLPVLPVLISRRPTRGGVESTPAPGAGVVARDGMTPEGRYVVSCWRSPSLSAGSTVHPCVHSSIAYGMWARPGSNPARIEHCSKDGLTHGGHIEET